MGLDLTASLCILLPLRDLTSKERRDGLATVSLHQLRRRHSSGDEVLQDFSGGTVMVDAFGEYGPADAPALTGSCRLIWRPTAGSASTESSASSISRVD